jgi:multidrug efflux pump subunit AcrA (membrane-fusion protein)
MRRKTLVLLLIVIVLATGALAFFWKRTGHMGITAGNEFPTATVHRASLQMDIYTDGDLRSVHTAVLLAPPVSGSLQILKLLRTGTSVKKDDVILQFDSSEQQYKLEQAQFDLAAAQQEVLKAKADSEVQQAQDQVALLKARFDVRRAELDVGRNELVSSIDAQKNNLALDEARRRLAQLEQDVKSRQVSNAAAVAVS